MTRDLEQEARNKTLVLEVFDALFNRRDVEAAERYWSPDYIQHSAGIGPGLDGLLALVRSVRRRYESTLAVAEGEYVMVHGRFSGGGRPTKIVVDILRVEQGRLAEHWDVMQDEATRPESKSGLRCSGTASRMRDMAMLARSRVTCAARGVEPSGIGQYYGKDGFDMLAHAKSMLISPPDVAIEQLNPCLRPLHLFR